MITKPSVEFGFRIPLNGEYQDYVNSTYEAFLNLAQRLWTFPRELEGPAHHFLTDNESISQLQDLYFLLRSGTLEVTEEKSKDGSAFLFLQVK